MFRVQYFCPRQSPHWQDANNNPAPTLDIAIAWAQSVKPPNGHARVLDIMGNLLYQI
jgi:hypothetical protein